MSDDRVWFVAERFEQLRDLLLEFGYALDPGTRDPNEWRELHYQDPPAGGRAAERRPTGVRDE